MKSTFSKILIWAAGLQYWEQASLRKVLSGTVLTEADYLELQHLFLQDAGLERPAAGRPALFTNYVEQNAQPAVGTPIKVRRVFNLLSVNALPTGQELTFGDQLTIIFGANGSGKTGYARVLACAAFARGERTILPDITKPHPSDPPHADIEIEDGNGVRVVHYAQGTRCADLAPLHVFDTKSVDAHLMGENLLAFFPAGLDHLAELARVTDQVRERLRNEIQQKRTSLSISQLYEGRSAVTESLDTLDRTLDIAMIEKLASLTGTDNAQIALLEKEISSIKATDVPSRIHDLRQEAADLHALRSSLDDLACRTSDGAVTEVVNVMRAWATAKADAQRAGTAQFKCEQFPQVGSEVWNRFVEAAWQLAVAESSTSDPYPHDGDICLLCRQPLSSHAQALLHRLWKHLASDAPTLLAATEMTRAERIHRFNAINPSFFGDTSPARRLLTTLKPELAERIESYIQACVARRNSALGILDSKTSSSPLPPLIPCQKDIEGIAAIKEAEATKLENENPSDSLPRLEAALRQLKHRRLLASHLQPVRDHVANRRWAQEVETHLGSTRHITLKQNELFDELVSQRYLAAFRETIASFGRPLSVAITTRGQKGQHVRRIVLSFRGTPPPSDAPIHEVLSDGEKRAVALADFLTEVTVNTSSAGIVFDDPVTSLDAEWKDALAQRLATEAKRRQVIIFTHDLVFFHMLMKHAENHKVAVMGHWIKRPENGNPGFVYLDNSPAYEREYDDARRAREKHAQALNCAPQAEETVLQQGFGALRTSYEVFIAAKILGGVVRRFEERIDVGRLKSLRWSDNIAQRTVEKFEYVSRFIEGHSHSDAFAPTKPTHAMLLQEIEAYESLRREHKALLK